MNKNTDNNTRVLSFVANAHIDPVWIWNRSSGRCSWNTTIMNTVRMMKMYPELHFTCSASTLYRWIEETDMRLFNDIRALVKEGRWEIVGGWEVQSDVIISRALPLMKQAEFGKAYFMDKFDIDVNIAYNVDAFGHTAGLPTILKKCGFAYYVYGRSQPTPLVFQWAAQNGDDVTALHLRGYGDTYGASRDAFIKRLERAWKQEDAYPIVFVGIGDHGGGIFQRHMEWIKEWQQTSGIPFRFTTLRDYFAAIDTTALPELSGELGPEFRGCYSACYKVKQKVATGLDRLTKAETMGVSADALSQAWQELLFHHFHDILPGTSVHEAYERDVFPGLGMVEHIANKTIDRELCKRDAAVDTRFMKEGGIQVWNPHVEPMTGIVSFDGFTDPNNHGTNFNTLRTEDGEEFPLQLLPSATSYGPCGDPWGRMTASIPLAPMTQKHLAYTRSDRKYPNIGFKRQRELLHTLSFQVFEDTSRTWGFGLTAFTHPAAKPEETDCVEFQDGPVCSILRVCYKHENSRIIMDLVAYAGIKEIEIRLDLDWHKTDACLKLLLDHGLSESLFFTGGCFSMDNRPDITASNTQQPDDEEKLAKSPGSGERAMIDWCAASQGDHHIGFYAADLHGCDHCDDRLRITLLRTTRYADHAPFEPAADSGYLDIGNTRMSLWYFEHTATPRAHLPGLARLRLQNAETHEVTIHEAGEPYHMKTPTVTTSSPALVVNVSPETVYAFNYGSDDETITIEHTAHTIPAHSLHVVNASDID